METENENKKADAENKSTEGANTPVLPSGVARSGSSFAERMGDAGYIAGRRYDAVKNTFLAYKTSERKPKSVRTRITRSGEMFYNGKKVLAKLCLVGGYLRLFLALDPKRYNADKYHHKDCSEIARYKKVPLMIKISSDRQEKYAVLLIDELLSSEGFVRDPNYADKDQANIFKKRRVKKSEASSVSVFAPVGREAASTITENAEPISANVKLPVRASVFDRNGERIGKIRKSVWTDEEGTEKGVFVKENNEVVLYEGQNRAGYVDKNDNILTTADGFVATLKRPLRLLLPIVLIVVAVLALLSVALSAYFILRSENTEYAPVLFIASENGSEWNGSEDLPVFANETFGDATAVPGMKGSYRFVFNNRNKNKLEYSLTFSESNEYGLSVLYRLKRDGAYVKGTDGYVGVSELNAEGLTVEAESSTLFELEWYWQDNDKADTAAGENSAIYTLTIGLSAFVSGQA